LSTFPADVEEDWATISTPELVVVVETLLPGGVGGEGGGGEVVENGILREWSGREGRKCCMLGGPQRWEILMGVCFWFRT
jgi:hypothetical protein